MLQQTRLPFPSCMLAMVSRRCSTILVVLECGLGRIKSNVCLAPSDATRLYFILRSEAIGDVLEGFFPQMAKALRLRMAMASILDTLHKAGLIIRKKSSKETNRQSGFGVAVLMLRVRVVGIAHVCSAPTLPSS